jgi:acetyltransferase-like isoleucine patch superfamily enzyme
MVVSFLPKIKRFANALLFYSYNHFYSNFPSYFIRHSYLKTFLGCSIGRDAAVHMGCFFTGRNIAIGNNTIVNRGCYLDGRGTLIIGNNVSIAPESYILSMTHDSQFPDFAPERKITRIDDYVWLGARVLVLPGVRLGIGCVIGAGSVVTDDIPAYTIAAGSPARKIGERNTNLNYTLKYRPLFDTDI